MIRRIPSLHPPKVPYYPMDGVVSPERVKNPPPGRPLPEPPTRPDDVVDPVHEPSKRPSDKSSYEF